MGILTILQKAASETHCQSEGTERYAGMGVRGLTEIPGGTGIAAALFNYLVVLLSFLC